MDAPTGKRRFDGDREAGMSEIKHGAARDDRENAYFAVRGLRQSAGSWSLWALGVGAVISGDFFGWNFGLPVAGSGGMAIAAVITAVMYICLCFSIAELASGMPFAGGAYAYARAAFGPWGGFIAGLAQSAVYILTTAVIVVGMAFYANTMTSDYLNFDIPNPVWWLVFYGLFTGINVAGASLTFRLVIYLTCLALVILAIFWLGAVSQVDASRWALNIGEYGEELADGDGLFLPFGGGGIVAALPYVIWFYLAIELIPLAGEESHNPRQDLPKAMVRGVITLVIASGLTLGLFAAIPPGASMLGDSGDPLYLVSQTVYGDLLNSTQMAAVSLIALSASLLAITYAFGRSVYALSRAGYISKWLSVTTGNRQTPARALIAGALIGSLICLLIEFGGVVLAGAIGSILLNTAVFAAVLSYFMQMAAYLKLKGKIARPIYVSPLGIPGAVTALLMGLVVLAALLMDEATRMGIYGVAIWLGTGLTWFAVFRRNRLTSAPEERFAREIEADKS